MPSHPILIRNHLRAAGALSEVLLVHEGRVVPCLPAPGFIGQFRDDGKGGLVAPAKAIGGGSGYIDTSGRWVVAPDLDDTRAFNEGLARYCRHGLWGFLRPDGSTAIAPRWRNVQPFHNGLAAVQVGPHAWRYIDPSGAFAFDGEFAWATPFGANGLAAARSGPHDKAGYLDRQGAWAIAPRFDQALRFFADEAAPAAIGEHAYGLIDSSGAWIVQPRYRYIDEFNAEGLAFCGRGQESWSCDTGFIDTRGALLFPGAWSGRNNMVDGVVRENAYTYLTRHGQLHFHDMDWGGELNRHGFAIGRKAHHGEQLEGQPTPPAAWGILRTDGQFRAVPANAREPLTDSEGMFEEAETDTPLALFIGDDDDLLMLDDDAGLAFRLRREACAQGQYAALYDAQERLLWTSEPSAAIALPAPFFVAPPHTLMDRLSSPDALIDFAKAMLLDTERKLHLLARDGASGDDGDENDEDGDEDKDEDENEDEDAALARRVASRSRIVRFYLNEELVGHYAFLAEERRALLDRIEKDCIARLSVQFGPADNDPDFAGRRERTWFHAWPVGLDTPLPGADAAPGANCLWLALNWSGDTGDGDEWGDLWLSCAPSLDTLDLALQAGPSEDEQDEEQDDNQDDAQKEEDAGDPAHMGHDALLALVAATPDGIGTLAEHQVSAELADAATAADAKALQHLPERFQTPERLEGLIRKGIDSARAIPEVCMSEQGLALARSLYGNDRRWQSHDASRCKPRSRWDQNALFNYWGALLDAGTSERALRAGVALHKIPLWLRTPELEALALQLDIRAVRTVRKEAIDADVAGRAVRQRRAHLLKYIPAPLRTPELCLSAVLHGGRTLEFVPEPLRGIALCTAALADDEEAILWVPDGMEEAVCTRLIDAELLSGTHAAGPAGGSRWHALRAWVRIWNADYHGAAADAALALGHVDAPVQAHFLLAFSYRALGRAFDSALEAATVLAMDADFLPDFGIDASWLGREAKATLAKADDQALLRGLRTHPLALSRISPRRITAAMVELAVAASPQALQFAPNRLMTPQLHAQAIP